MAPDHSPFLHHKEVQISTFEIVPYVTYQKVTATHAYYCHPTSPFLLPNNACHQSLPTCDTLSSHKHLQNFKIVHLSPLKNYSLFLQKNNLSSFILTSHFPNNGAHQGCCTQESEIKNFVTITDSFTITVTLTQTYTPTLFRENLLWLLVIILRVDPSTYYTRSSFDHSSTLTPMRNSLDKLGSTPSLKIIQHSLE